MARVSRSELDNDYPVAHNEARGLVFVNASDVGRTRTITLDSAIYFVEAS